jgi:NDP-sugar pyrophosphorylase family protein
MNAIICAAGKGSRISAICHRYGVTSKCLLPIGDKTILDMVIQELLHVGVTRLVIVVGEHNLEEIRSFCLSRDNFKEALCTFSDFRISLAVQYQSFHGTTAAVVSGMQHREGPFLLVWSDMIFRFPHGFSSSDPPAHNIVFTTSMSHRQSTRFDGIVCSGNRVMAFSPRAIEKPGPFLINTGVYYIKDVEKLITSIQRMVSLYGNALENVEIPIEWALQEMLTRGTIFTADSLEFFVDLGTSDNYLENMRVLYGGSI